MFRDVWGKDSEEQTIEKRIEELDWKREKLLERLPVFDPMIISTAREKTIRFTKEKLASILFYNLECNHPRRDLIDWSTSEKFVRENGNVEIFDDFTQKCFISMAYLDGTSVFIENYNEIIFRLGEYSNYYIWKLIVRVAENYNFAAFDKYVGKIIWLWGWESALSHLFPTEYYTKVKFY